jgi:hypothetical protein
MSVALFNLWNFICFMNTVRKNDCTRKQYSAIQSELNIFTNSEIKIGIYYLWNTHRSIEVLWKSSVSPADAMYSMSPMPLTAEAILRFFPYLYQNVLGIWHHCFSDHGKSRGFGSGDVGGQEQQMPMSFPGEKAFLTACTPVADGKGNSFLHGFKENFLEFIFLIGT